MIEKIPCYDILSYCGVYRYEQTKKHLKLLSKLKTEKLEFFLYEFKCNFPIQGHITIMAVAIAYIA